MRTVLLTLTVCVLVLPATAKYSGGTGEPNDPYQIATAADLIALGETPEDYDKRVIVTADDIRASVCRRPSILDRGLSAGTSVSPQSADDGTYGAALAALARSAPWWPASPPPP